MAISWQLTPKRGIFTAFVQKTWQFHGQKNFLAMKILGHFLKKRSSNWKKHGNFMAFKKKIQKNRNVAELPRFESPDVAFQNFPAATLCIPERADEAGMKPAELNKFKCFNTCHSNSLYFDWTITQKKIRLSFKIVMFQPFLSVNGACHCLDKGGRMSTFFSF